MEPSAKEGPQMSIHQNTKSSISSMKAYRLCNCSDAPDGAPLVQPPDSEPPQHICSIKTSPLMDFDCG